MDSLTPKKHSTHSKSPTKSTTVPSRSPSKNVARSLVHDDHKPTCYSSSASASSGSKTPKYKSTRDLKSPRGFFNCIGKHLGCHFLQPNLRHMPQHQLHSCMYNSQDDLPSSSTDSFSLSYERGSHMGFHLTGSNIDLSYSGADNLAQQSKHHKQLLNQRQQQQSQCASRNTLSSAYSASSYSPAFCAFDVDCLVDTYNGDGDDEADVCVSPKRYHQHHSSDVHVTHSYRSGHKADSNSSDDDDECSTHDECCEQQQKRKTKLEQQHQQQHNGQQKHSATHKRLHLSRTSIAYSVSRMLSHFASSTSMRSLSCSNTPLRCFKDSKPKEADDEVHLTDRNMNDKNKKHSLPSASCSSSNGSRSSSSGNSSGNNSSGGSSNCSTGNSKNNNNRNSHSSSSSSSSTVNGKKKEKKQQSILRPPVHYVYMKGMSGLYSRVPRYTVCSTYAMH